jgi:putative hydrolase of the HAD superfamily
MTAITHLFTDLGGVLLTNGWDRGLRKVVAQEFGLDAGETQEMDERHHLTYDTYESGKMDLEEYLRRILFFRARSFTSREVIDFILNQARAFPEMIELVCGIKGRYGLKVAVLSNEGRELTVDRIARFHLREFVDFFIVSAFVHLRKPDEQIFRLALDVAQADPGAVAYLDDRGLFCEVAERMGIHAVWHRDLETTRAALAQLGLAL